MQTVNNILNKLEEKSGYEKAKETLRKYAQFLELSQNRKNICWQ